MKQNRYQVNYLRLIRDIGAVYSTGKIRSYTAINSLLVKTYWEIGRKIVNYEQAGQERAEYGSDLLDRLAKDLKSKYGKGFSRRNVLNMRRFFQIYPIWQTVSAKLNWSQYILLIGITDNKARKFYENMVLEDKLSVRELERQIDSMLYERSKLSDFKNITNTTVLKENQDIESFIKDPYIFEFLSLSENSLHSEKELEQKLIANLEMFLLELGRGFTFVKEQYRISLGVSHYFVDLVFYHRILKCFVLIDLKLGRVKHYDIGQMNLYLNFFNKEENSLDDNPAIGLVLSAEKNEIDVEYALGGITNRLFVSKYQIYLPKKNEIKARFQEILSK
ncbi:MAG: PDDEXK nuclease domain-containing protein [bacterium]